MRNFSCILIVACILFEMAKASGRKSIYQSSVYLYYIMKIFGMAFFGVDGKFHKFQTSCFHYLGVFVFVGYWIYQNILYFDTQIYYESGLNYRIIESIWRNVYAFQNLSIIPIILFNFIKRKHLENFLQLIEKFDSQMEYLEWENRVGISKIFCFLPFFPIPTMIVNHVILLSLNLSEIYFMHPPYVYHVKFVAYLTLMEIFFIICYIFVGSCYCICCRINALIESMRLIL